MKIHVNQGEIELLEARYVIHAAVMGQDLITDEYRIRNATRARRRRRSRAA